MIVLKINYNGNVIEDKFYLIDKGIVHIREDHILKFDEHSKQFPV